MMYLVTIGSLFISAVCPAQSTGSTFAINGVLYEAEFGEPLKDVMVRIFSPKAALRPGQTLTHSDSDGHFSLRLLWPDTFRIEASTHGLSRIISAPIILSQDHKIADVQFAVSIDYAPEMDKFKDHPSSWKEVDGEGRFSFFLPDTFEGECSHAGDSFWGKYNNGSMTVGFDDVGLKFPKPESLSQTKVIAGCRRAHVSFMSYDVKTGTSNHSYIVSLDFPGWRRLTLYTAYDDHRLQDLALRILLSITFDDP